MFTILLLCLFTTIGHASSLIERKMFDPYIICHNPPPPAYDLPAGYSSESYRTSMDLCSAANGRKGKNMGCFCSSSHSDLHCDPNIADSTLSESTTSYWNHTHDHPESFAKFCEIACYCADTKSATMARNSIQRNSELNRVLNSQYDPFPFTDTNGNDALPPVYFHDQCTRNCSTHTDCGGGERGCKCKTQSEQYIPGKGMVMFAAACVFSLGGKREARMPCPCNATYVSYACCEATDGIVREPKDFKLGEMLGSDEL